MTAVYALTDLDTKEVWKGDRYLCEAALRTAMRDNPKRRIAQVVDYGADGKRADDAPFPLGDV